jgi:hypothetical protein
MSGPCDLCNQPVLEGEPRFGGMGDGGKSGAPFGFSRHYRCHTDRFGKPASTSVWEDLRSIQTANGTLRVPRRTILKPRVLKGPDSQSENATREWRQLGPAISEMGRRRIEIECPFCFATFWAYVWSLYGGGKRCPNCRAFHTGKGLAQPLEGNEDLTCDPATPGA